LAYWNQAARGNIQHEYVKTECFFQDQSNGAGETQRTAIDELRLA